MHTKKRMDTPVYRLFFFVVIGIIIAVSAYIQFTLYMNIDASNALHETQILFSGGHYFSDFYEATPPMFLYLYYPIFLCHHLFQHADFVVVFFIYYLVLSLISLVLCAEIPTRHFSTDNFWHYLFLLLIFSLYLIQLPCFFGEREHTLIILTLPYFILLAARIDGKRVTPTLCYLIGFISALGFSIKPQFCFSLLFGEIYLLLSTKKWRLLLRKETCIIYTIFILYVISTFLLYPDYYEKMLSLSSVIYYQGISSSWFNLLTLPTLHFALLIVFFYGLTYNKKNSALASVFVVAMLGFVTSYFSQFAVWEYHFFPTYCMALMLSFVLLREFYYQDISEKRKLLYAIFFILVYLFYIKNNIIFSFVKPLYSIFFALFLILWITKKRVSNDNLNVVPTIFLALLLFSYPLFTDSYAYAHFAFEKKEQSKIVNFMHRYAYQQPVYFLESVLDYEYPLVDYAGAIHVSRFPYLVWMPAYIQQIMHDPHLSPKTVAMVKLHRYFMTLLSQDILNKKPTYIFVDTSHKIATISFPIVGFNYLAIFLQNTDFKNAWRNYHYFKTIDAEPYYRFDVYQLNKKS